jgi:hypothetical protein
LCSSRNNSGLIIVFEKIKMLTPGSKREHFDVLSLTSEGRRDEKNIKLLIF